MNDRTSSTRRVTWWLAAATGLIAATGVAVGVHTTSSAARPQQVSDEEFEERFSPCPDGVEFGPLDAFSRVTSWGRLVEVAEQREISDETDELELRITGLAGSDGEEDTTAVSAHESFVAGLEFGLELEDATVVIAIEPGVENRDSLFAALILLDDGRILAPGMCMMQSLGIGTNVSTEQRGANIETLRSLIGLTGSEVDAALSTTSQSQGAEASAPEQVSPGLNDDALRSAGVPVVEVVITWPDSWTNSDDIVCFQTAYGWGQCLSLAAGPTETAWGVYVDPSEPWLRVWRSRATARFDIEAAQVAEVVNALPTDRMTLVIIDLTGEVGTVSADRATTCPRSEVLPVCADSDEMPAPQPTSSDEITYTVQPGDSLNSISQRFDVTIEEICDANGWDDCAAHVLLPNDSVIIPSGATLPVDDSGIPLCDDGTSRSTHTLVAGDTPASVAERFGLTVAALAEANAANPAYSTFVIGAVIWGPCDSSAGQ